MEPRESRANPRSRTSSLDRRQALVAGVTGLVATGPLGVLARAHRRSAGASDSPAPAHRKLVLVQLSGGNDGLDTVVPHADQRYHDARPKLRRREADLLRLDDRCGLHPELRGMHGAWQRGELSIIEGCGYPRPNRSHFKSMDIWHAGDRRGRNAGEGWVGRLAQAVWGQQGRPNRIVHVGDRLPFSLHSGSHPAVSFSVPEAYRWAGELEEVASYERASRGKGEPDDALARIRQALRDTQESSAAIRRATATYRPRAEYPDEDFATSLRHVAALIHGGEESRIFSVELGGFDTHRDADSRRRRLMGTLDRGLTALLDDLRGTPQGEQTLVLVFSEFGRRLAENGAGGTDHGVAAPMFLLGSGVRGGFAGSPPSLEHLVEGDLAHTTDFRSVYGSIARDWMGADPTRVVGGDIEPLRGLLVTGR